LASKGKGKDRLREKVKRQLVEQGFTEREAEGWIEHHAQYLLGGKGRRVEAASGRNPDWAGLLKGAAVAFSALLALLGLAKALSSAFKGGGRRRRRRWRPIV